MGAVHFSLDPDLVAALKSVLELPVLVETGTFRGDTPLAMADKFSRIITVELSEELHKSARNRLREHDHIVVLQGSSPEVLQRLREELVDESVLYWLDAHWCVAASTAGDTSQCPLIEELTAIGQLNKNSVIMIDDARLFLTTPPAPHEASHWPQLHQIVTSLNKLSSQHEIQVINDVIAFAPPSARSALAHHARHRGINWLHILKLKESNERKVVETRKANARLKKRIENLQENNGQLQVRIEKLERELGKKMFSRILRKLYHFLPEKKS